ncbi:hypothetical protein ACFVT5_39720 [Streptomyces sp. NPDC058001]|uniref:hypothetical protein n=1 Tax=Streptomyces sp. NPDC058001 TaxID=3346300 RepID=UPI0036E09F6B
MPRVGTIDTHTRIRFPHHPVDHALLQAETCLHLSYSNEANRLRSARERRPEHPGVEEAEKYLRALYENRGKGARELYTELLADVNPVMQARTNYAAALEMPAGLPQFFLGA